MNSRAARDIPALHPHVLPTNRHVTFTSWEGDLELTPSEPLTYADPYVSAAPPIAYDTRVWESPVVESAFPARELVPSWNARTPAGTWISVEVRVHDDGGWSSWLVLARWCELDPAAGGAITRTTVSGQRSGAVRVNVDTVIAADGLSFSSWQLRITAASATPGGWPTITLAGAMVSAFAPVTAGSSPGPGLGVELPVRPLSQRRHVDSFPHWDNGGQSWCSATSTAMVLDHWEVAPTATETAWVGHGADPEVVHVVRQVFDRDYGGAGNWAFNAAYAGTRGMRAHVTRLRDLTEAEAFIATGIPLVVAVTFTRDELPGAGYDTKGHLLTIVGFTADGDVISNDPNSHEVPSNDEVRVVFARDQFERVWSARRGGLTYVIHPPEHPLPHPPGEANW